jgi:hypothetical protein
MTVDVRTDTPNLAVVIPNWEGERTRRLIASLPPCSYRRLVLVGAPADVEVLGGARVRPGGGGYAAGCRAGVEYLGNLPEGERPEVVVFLDSRCDGAQVGRVAGPVVRKESPVVVGSRRMRKLAPGTIPLPVLLRNWVTCVVIRRVFGKVYTDVGPFRAVAWEALPKTGTGMLGLPIKAVRAQLKVLEVPVDYHR